MFRFHHVEITVSTQLLTPHFSFQGTITFGTFGLIGLYDYSGVSHCFIGAGIRYLGLCLSLETPLQFVVAIV